MAESSVRPSFNRSPQMLSVPMALPFTSSPTAFLKSHRGLGHELFVLRHLFDEIDETVVDRMRGFVQNRFKIFLPLSQDACFSRNKLASVSTAVCCRALGKVNIMSLTYRTAVKLVSSLAINNLRMSRSPTAVGCEGFAMKAPPAVSVRRVGRWLGALLPTRWISLEGD